MLVARYAENEVIDFDNFVCCLVKLEAMFSMSHESPQKCFWKFLKYLICVFLLYKEFFLSTEAFQELDRENTGTVELNITEVFKHCSLNYIICSIHVTVIPTIILIK